MWRQDTVDNFKPKEKSYKETENNLIVRIQPSGVKTYYANVNRRDKKIGDCSLIPLKEARKIKDEMRLEGRKGIREESKLTFKQFIETKDFLDWSKMKRDSHEKRIESLYQIVVPFLGEIKLRNIDIQVINRYINHRGSKDEVANSTIERNLTDIRAVLRCAFDYKYINELIKIPPMKVDKGKEPRILSDDEIKRLRKVLRDNEGLSEYHIKLRKHMPLLVDIALLTGARKSEILNLTWEDLLGNETTWKEIKTIPLQEETDEEDDSLEELKEQYKTLVESSGRVTMLQFKGLITKSRQTRFVPVGKELADDLMDYYWNNAMTREEFLEYSESRVEIGGNIDQIKAMTIRPEDKKKRIFPMDEVKTAFNNSKRKAELNSEVTFHSLRHTFCTRALESFGNIDTVKKLAGHSDIRTTQQYLHLLDKQKLIEDHQQFANSYNFHSDDY